MKNQRLLNTLHSLTHWQSHIEIDSNDGYVWALVKMLTIRKVIWPAMLWCPVCTLTALWLWLGRNEVYYGK